MSFRLLLVLMTALATAYVRAPTARAEETSLRALARAFESSLTRRDEASYARQATALEAIAGERTAAARDLLEQLLARYGAADRRRAALILGALVRYGLPRDLDAAIQWTESRKDPLLVDLLHRIVGEATLPATRAHLRGAALRGAAPRVKAQILRALGATHDVEALPGLMQAAREEHLLVRVEALEALGVLGDKRARPVLQAFLRHEQLHVRDAAARGLGLLGDPGARASLESALQDEAPLVAESAAGALARIDDWHALPALIAALERVGARDLRLADAFTQALQALSGKDIHADAELWRSWWVAMQGRPFEKSAEKPGRRTVPGPSYYGFPVRSSRVLFVLDVSRSMGWNGRLDSATEELVQVLENLPTSTRFNVVVYSDRAWAWRKGLESAKPALVKRAVAFVRSQRPLKGTNTYAALAAAFDDPEADTVFILSDGHPSMGRVTDPELILSQVREWNRFRRMRIHGVALMRGRPPAAFASMEDPERSEAFMRELARANDGRFKLVR